MPRSSNVLLCAHPTVGHTQALRAIGGDLLRRGHAVTFAMPSPPRLPSFLPTPEPLRAAQKVDEGLASDGFQRARVSASLRSAFAAARTAKNRGYDELSWACELFTCDALANARELVREIQARRIDVVAADFVFFGAWIAAEAAGVPFAAVFHSGLPFDAPGQPPFGSGLDADASPIAWRKAVYRLLAISDKVDRRLSAARKSFGLGPAPDRLLSKPYAKGLNVITSFEAFELPRPDLEKQAAGPLLWAGPCLGARGEPAPAPAGDDFPWDKLAGPAPTVYISLGTVFNDQPLVYEALLRGAQRAGVRAVVAAGGSVDRVAAMAGPGDVVVRFAPQLALLGKVGAMIGHGGNNSTNEALRAGRPLVVVPFGAEQIANGQRVTALGVGKMLRPDELSVETVRAALVEAMSEETRGRARRLAASVPKRDGAPVVADALLELVAQA